MPTPLRHFPWPCPIVLTRRPVNCPGRRCEGTTDDETFGMLGRWEATEAWCASAKLGVIRELIRRTEPGRGGGLSSAGVDGLVQEVSNQLGVSMRGAGANGPGGGAG